MQDQGFERGLHRLAVAERANGRQCRLGVAGRQVRLHVGNPEFELVDAALAALVELAAEDAEFDHDQDNRRKSGDQDGIEQRFGQLKEEVFYAHRSLRVGVMRDAVRSF